MKKILLLSLSLLLMLNLGCARMVPVLKTNKVVEIGKQQSLGVDKQEKLDETIGCYLQEKLGYRILEGKVFEAHELYGTREKDGKTYAYMWSRLQEYVYIDGALVSGAGTSLPVRVALEKNGAEQYTAAEYKVPKDGEQYVSSVKTLFPEEYQEKILTRVNANELEEIVRQKAENYFVSQKDENNKASNENTKFKQVITTPLFELRVPESWSVDKRPDNTLLFKKGNKVYGGLDILAHYSNQPISSLFPNHSEVTEQSMLTGFPVNVFMAVMKLSQPAAAMDKTVTEQVHYYFLVDGFAYDLYFNTEMVDRQTALAIAGTLKVIKAVPGNNEKDGDIKTGTGSYTGQIDNNSIEIKISLASGIPTPTAFRLSDKVREKFQKLNLKPSDAVAISYIKNGYDQLVIIDIKKHIN